MYFFPTALFFFVLSVYFPNNVQGLSFKHFSIALNSLTANSASLSFDMVNEMTTPVTISHMSANIGVLGIPILTFDHDFGSSFVIPASGTVNSGNITNATLTEGFLSTVQIILLPSLDVIEADITSSIQQLGVPTK